MGKNLSLFILTSEDGVDGDDRGGGWHLNTKKGRGKGAIANLKK